MLSWVPRVLNDERAENEREGVLDGLPDYHIKDIDAQGKMTVSPQRSVYYPIFYATLPKTSPLYGLDLRSEPATLIELNRLRTKISSASRGSHAGQRRGKQAGFLFRCRYTSAVRHDTIADRRRNLIGFVHGSVITAKMWTSSSREQTPKGLDCFSSHPATARKPCRTICILRGFAPRHSRRCLAPRRRRSPGAALSRRTASPG